MDDPSHATLASLSRSALIELARRHGVERPEPLTRAELEDEIVRRTIKDDRHGTTARGWFGAARDLVAGLVERGLHLPDAAKVIRGDGLLEPLHQHPVATVTLAEIYATQGHVRRALNMLAEVLHTEPDHELARDLQRRLAEKHESTLAANGRSGSAPPQADPPHAEGTEPTALSEEPTSDPRSRDAAPTASRGSASQTTSDSADDEGNQLADVVFTSLAQGQLRVAWELRRRTLERDQGRRPDARLVLQVAWSTPHLDGPRQERQIVELATPTGVLALGAPPGAIVARAAVGWQQGLDFSPLLVAADLDSRDAIQWQPWGWSAPTDATSRAIARLRAMN